MTVLIILLIIISFSEGLLELYGINTFYTRLICVCLIISIFLFGLIEQNNKIKAFGLIKPLLFLLLISIISLFLNEVNFISFLLFLIFVFIYPLLFFAILNYNFNYLELQKIFRTIEVVFIVQIVFGIIKLISFGPSEKNIGTLTVGSGSLGFIFPAIAIGYYYSKFLMKKRIWDLILIIGFLVFGISSDKRAIVLFVPILIIVGLIFYNKKFNILQKHLNPKIIISLVSLIVIFIYSSIRIMPSLNPDNKVGGKFDLDFTINYVINYNKSKPNYIKEMKRPAALIYFPNILIKKDVLNFLFGNGPGDTIGSRLKDNRVDPMAQKYGVRYGGRTTFIWLILQVGILGFLAFLWFYFKLFRIIYRNFMITNHINIVALSITLILFTLTFLIDIMIYSNSFFKSFAIMNIFNILIGISLNYKNFYLSDSQNLALKL